jgi:hypothetical protein
MTNTALTTQTFNNPTQAEFDTMREQANTLVKTGFLPVSIKTAEQALAIILTGRELGVPAMTALNGINVIQGKPTVSPQLMLGLIGRSGLLEDIKIKVDDAGATVLMKRRGRTAHTEFFGYEEAKAMGLLTKDNYKKQATTMYKWRAVSACARIVFPDVLLGLYTHEEIAPDALVNEEGELVDSPFYETVAEVVETVPVKQEKKVIKPKKKNEVSEEERRAQLITSCGIGFRNLNELGFAPKWNLDSINEMIQAEFGVEGGIHNLTTEQIDKLDNQIGAMYRLLTEGHDNPEAFDAVEAN